MPRYNAGGSLGFPGGPQSQERVFDMLTRATDNGAARQWCSGERCQHRDLRYIGKPRVGYSATKAAIIQLMKTTAVIYAAKGVRSNTVVSGLMVPPYTICIVSRYADSQAERYMEMRHVQVPMGKMGEAWDVVSATFFLVSDEAQYITGQELIVDGGITSSTGGPNW